MKSIWMVSMVAVVGAGCGQIQGLPWDKNHDGIVAQCEGLDKFFCNLTPNCQGQELACLAICQDDGKGGCVPCANDFQCVPVQPKACFQLTDQQCSSDPRCELVNAPTGSNIRIPEDQPLNSFCREKATGCAAVPLNSCAALPGCEVQQVTMCTGVGGAFQEESDKAAPPFCAEDLRADEALAPAQDAGTPPGCGGGCTTISVCTEKRVATCEQRDVATCTQLPECELVSGPVCDVACFQGSNCPPCANPSQFCATKHKNACDGVSPSLCTASVGCKLEPAACLAVCEDDGMGGCLPCPAVNICVPL